ncbi:MAG: mechanosensitive ion channel [Kouleothrix sp.]|nr:mechanosensitive ion channel [Kouleothrix sp.]
MNFQIVVDALTKIVIDIINFIPNLVNGLIILLVGYLIARLVRWVLTVVLGRLKLDPLIERTGITGSLRGLGVKTPISQIIAQTIFTLLLLSFLITSTRLMGLEAVARLLEQLLSFLPNLIAALIIFMLGGVASQFVGNLVATVGLAGGLTYAGRVGRIVQYLISLFVVVLALGQLGVDTAILVTAITITIAAFGLALGLALGLGARGVVYNVLAGYYMRQRFPVGQPIALGDVRGEVGAIGGVSTLVDTADGAVVIPNSTLLESLVRSPRPAAPPQPPDAS